MKTSTKTAMAIWKRLAKQSANGTLYIWDAQRWLEQVGHDAVASGIDWLWAPHTNQSHREQARRNLQTLAQRKIAELEAL